MLNKPAKYTPTDAWLELVFEELAAIRQLLERQAPPADSVTEPAAPAAAEAVATNEPAEQPAPAAKPGRPRRSGK